MITIQKNSFFYLNFIWAFNFKFYSFWLVPMQSGLIQVSLIVTVEIQSCLSYEGEMLVKD